MMIAILGLMVAAPAAAQEWQVARESFAFVGTRLTIHVDAETAGTLRVIRGAPGSVRVASRAVSGFTTAGLDDRRQLSLAAAGPGPVDYMVSVPDQVWIEVRLPDRTFPETVGGHTRARTFEWDEARREARPAVDEWLPPLFHDQSFFTTFTAHAAPDVVSLPDLTHVRSISVRFEDHRFRVRTNRPLAVEGGDPRRLEIRPGGPDFDVILTLPPRTRSFRLEAGLRTALTIQDGTVATLCSPVTDQQLSHGRRWLTFNPRDGQLDCDAPPTPRHEG